MLIYLQVMFTMFTSMGAAMFVSRGLCLTSFSVWRMRCGTPMVASLWLKIEVGIGCPLRANQKDHGTFSLVLFIGRTTYLLQTSSVIDFRWE